MHFTKKNLYRKVNTRARGVSHNSGGDFNHVRNKRRETVELVKGSMHGRTQRGYDYTPLFKFLLKKVGSNWDEVYSEAISRLDKQEPIFWIVAIHENERQEYIRVGESSYYSGMYVDADGILRLTKAFLGPENMEPFCSCCTHTLNGQVFK